MRLKGFLFAASIVSVNLGRELARIALAVFLRELRASTVRKLRALASAPSSISPFSLYFRIEFWVGFGFGSFGFG
jgi:hypothetical protein